MGIKKADFSEVTQKSIWQNLMLIVNGKKKPLRTLKEKDIFLKSAVY